MPKRKERAGRYIRESDERLIAGTTTMESQTKAVNEYCEREHYICEPEHEWREAISSVEVPYMERKALLAMLAAAKRREFDVLVVSEIRALSRRQVEVLVIYDMLQKYGVRLETVKEKFGEDAMSKAILSLRAMFVEIEVEQSKMRMNRGRADRLAIGGAPNAHPKAAYGYIFINTEKEVKGAYEFNHTIIFVDEERKEWSEYKVVLFIFDLLKQGESLTKVVRILNTIGIPTPKKKARNGKNGHWQRGTLHSIITNPIYIGEVWANRFTHIRSPKTNKCQPKLRHRNEWVLLPEGTAPALIDRETFEAIQKRLQINKEDSLRNNKHPEELGLLRAGYIFCGVCGRRMHLTYPTRAAKARGSSPWYSCQQKSGATKGRDKHRTQIHVPMIDALVHEKIVEVVQQPDWIRERVAELRHEIAVEQPVISTEDIEATIANIRQKMQNLYTFAENAPDDEELARLTQRLQELAKQKREAEAMLYHIADEEEKQQALEAEIVKFEQWAAAVRDDLTNPSYKPTYEELRLAVRIIGIKVTVFPSQGDWPYRYKVDAIVPEVLKKLVCVNSDPRLLRPISA